MGDEHLTARMGLDRSAFSDGLAAAQREAQSFGGTLNTALSLIKGGAIGAGIGVVVGSLRSWAQEAKHVLSSSEDLGVSVAFYKALGKEFRKLGEDGDAGDKALAHFAETLAKARKGNADAMRAFGKLGLQDSINEWVDSEDAIGAVRGEFDRMGPSVERTTIAIELFTAKGATKMLAVLREMPREIGNLEKAMALMEQMVIAKGATGVGYLWNEFKGLASELAQTFVGFARLEGPATTMNKFADAAVRKLEADRESARIAAAASKAEADATKHMHEQDVLLKKSEAQRKANAQAQKEIVHDLEREVAEHERIARIKEHTAERARLATERLDGKTSTPLQDAQRDFVRDVGASIDIAAANRLEIQYAAGARLAGNLGQFNTAQTLRGRRDTIAAGIEAALHGANAPDERMGDLVKQLRDLIGAMKRGEIITKPVNGK
ncbi:MAG TPA: hypothetical protein VI454_16710 [Verrucomicrobiae bacterium]|jgi:hypothetical protein